MAIIRFLLVALLLFIVVTIAAFVYLEWWQALIVIVGMIFAIVLGAKFIIRSFIGNIGKALMQGFEIKGKVLRGATAEVHAIEAVPAPPPKVIDQADDEDEDENEYEDEDDGDDNVPAGRGGAGGDDEEDEADRAYYRIDVTIRPHNGEGPMTHWDVGDLCVVDHKAPPLNLTLGEDSGAGEGYHFEDVKIFENGRLHPDEEGKYEGPQRLNVLVGVPAGLRELKFRYYAEQFGRIVLPPPYPRDGDTGGPGDARGGQQPQLA